MGVCLLITGGQARPNGPFSDPIQANADSMLAEGRQTFRFDTFGDEAFWGGTLRLHEAVAQLPPTQALALGLKVDASALPANVLAALRNGHLNLNDPAVTQVLLRHNAVVGVQGFFSGDSLSSVGITCALCHSTVDNSVAPGVGSRLDGWANRDLNVGAIIAAAPNLAALAQVLGVPVETAQAVLQSWGPGKFDAELLLDGRALRPDGHPAATLLPPAFGLAGVNQHTWTGGWGNVTYWNAFVANLEMGGQGTFVDPRLNDPDKYPIAAANGFFDVRHPSDRITPKLGALHFYQLAIPAPRPPAGSFNAAAAARGALVFNSASCTRCHVPPLYTEPGYNTHTASEIGIDDFQASRSPDERYRTSPLKGLWTHTRGGFYHDGRFPTLMDVVIHYNDTFNLQLNPGQMSDLVEFLKSL
jgi:cytochrome c5